MLAGRRGPVEAGQQDPAKPSTVLGPDSTFNSTTVFAFSA
jgi:hypothetical protein